MTDETDLVLSHQPTTLFGTNDPDQILETVSAVATSLGKVILDRGLFSQIGPKKHVSVEGWTLLGTLLGVFPVVRWTRPLPDGRGWEARVEAVTRSGEVVGAAEAMCTRDEPPGKGGKDNRWKDAADYAVRSMAQTRATSKALRGPLGFVIELAGYSATPDEEIPREESEGKEPSRTRQSVTGKGTATVTVDAQAQPSDLFSGDAATPTVCPTCGQPMIRGDLHHPGGKANVMICSDEKCGKAVTL